MAGSGPQDQPERLDSAYGAKIEASFGLLEGSFALAAFRWGVPVLARVGLLPTLPFGHVLRIGADWLWWGLVVLATINGISAIYQFGRCHRPESFPDHRKAYRHWRREAWLGLTTSILFIGAGLVVYVSLSWWPLAAVGASLWALLRLLGLRHPKLAEVVADEKRKALEQRKSAAARFLSEHMIEVIPEGMLSRETFTPTSTPDPDREYDTQRRLRSGEEYRVYEQYLRSGSEAAYPAYTRMCASRDKPPVSKDSFYIDVIVSLRSRFENRSAADPEYDQWCRSRSEEAYREYAESCRSRGEEPLTADEFSGVFFKRSHELQKRGLGDFLVWLGPAKGIDASPKYAAYCRWCAEHRRRRVPGHRFANMLLRVFDESGKASWREFATEVRPDLPNQDWSAYLTWCGEAGRIPLAEHRFDEATREYRKESTPYVRQFAEHVCEHLPVPWRDLSFDNYRAWTKTQGVPSLARREFLGRIDRWITKSGVPHLVNEYVDHLRTVPDQAYHEELTFGRFKVWCAAKQSDVLEAWLPEQDSRDSFTKAVRGKWYATEREQERVLSFSLDEIPTACNEAAWQRIRAGWREFLYGTNPCELVEADYSTYTDWCRRRQRPHFPKDFFDRSFFMAVLDRTWRSIEGFKPEWERAGNDLLYGPVDVAYPAYVEWCDKAGELPFPRESFEDYVSFHRRCLEVELQASYRRITQELATRKAQKEARRKEQQEATMREAPLTEYQKRRHQEMMGRAWEHLQERRLQERQRFE